jgi:hypothetical protein
MGPGPIHFGMGLGWWTPWGTLVIKSEHLGTPPGPPPGPPPGVPYPISNLPDPYFLTYRLTFSDFDPGRTSIRHSERSNVWESVEFDHFSTIKREIGASGGEHAVISYHVSYLVRYMREDARTKLFGTYVSLSVQNAGRCTPASCRQKRVRHEGTQRTCDGDSHTYCARRPCKPMGSLPLAPRAALAQRPSPPRRLLQQGAYPEREGRHAPQTAAAHLSSTMLLLRRSFAETQ